MRRSFLLGVLLTSLVSAWQLRAFEGGIFGGGHATSGGGGSGDVVGPASATDNAICRFDLATGKLIQNSNAFVADNGDLDLTETTAPSATSGLGKFYVKSSDSLPYFKDDGGTEYSLTGGGGGMSIGGAVTGGTTGSVLFVGAGVLAQDNISLYYDDATDELRLGGPLKMVGSNDWYPGVDGDGNVGTQGNRFSEGWFNNLGTERVQITEHAVPGTPSSGYGFVYEKSDGLLYFKNDGGTEYDLTATGAGTVTGTGTANRLAYWSSSSAITSDADLTFDGTTFVAQALTANDSSLDRVSIAAGTLADTKRALSLTATLPTTNTALALGILEAVTSAGSSAFEQHARRTTLGPGYTGALSTLGYSVSNTAASTSTDSIFFLVPAATLGGQFFAGGSGTGNRMGIRGYSDTATGVTVGIHGAAGISGSSPGYGVLGIVQTGSTGIAYPGYFTFSIQGSTPVSGSAALVADTGSNGGTVADIFQAKANGSNVVMIDNDGDISTVATVSMSMSQVTSGTPDFIRVPTDIVSGAVTHPTCSSDTNAGQITYFDDTSDALSGELCVCRADLTNAYSWVKVADNVTACI